MQAPLSWTPPTGTLGAILQETTQRVLGLRNGRGELERRAASAPAPLDVRAALAGATVAVIAEVKRRSPSGGEIATGLEAAAQAELYERGGASMVSILTEPAHFSGSVHDLESTRSRVSIPLLKKDFHVDEVQILEARAIGASAVLLIARALPPATLAHLVRIAFGLGLEPLVEVRTDAELDAALGAGARLIGVNSRNLESLEVDPEVARRLIAKIPRGVISVWESGVKNSADVAAAAQAGADAVLVGSALSAAGDPASAVRALASVSRGGGPRG